MNGAFQLMNGDSGGSNGAATKAEDLARIAGARERFAAGADSVEGVRPEVLMSWYRCREQYQVDPELDRAPPAAAGHPHSMTGDVVFAELGGHAAMAAHEVDESNGLAAVTDAGGRILASWGSRRIQDIAAESNLAPWAAWSEATAGTNGMGSALESHGPVLVRGPEHWCHGFHGWECAGVTIRDVVTGRPLGVLNVSCWHTQVADGVVSWLRKAAAATEAKLQQQAQHHGSLLSGAFAEARVPAGTPLAVVDIAGKVVLATQTAAALLGTPTDASPAHSPTRRWKPQLPTLPELIHEAVDRAKTHPDWSGSTQVFVPFLDTRVPVDIRPVLAGDQVIGMLLAFSNGRSSPVSDAGEAVDDKAGASDGLAARSRQPMLSRVVAYEGDRWALLDPREIRFAAVDHNSVWLATDRGRLLAASRGLEHLEEQLGDRGFVRVHRSYLVNLGRIREVELGFKGALVLTTDARRRETVPVARRHAPQIRHLLGL
jgi:hypothetical protein